MANTDEEIELLKGEIQRLGGPNPAYDDKITVKFGKIVRDDRCSNIFEALVGTLRAAKRKKVITYNTEMLLQGVHDDIDIVLLQ
ncbi:hypothetical protein PUNSTDRAFT_50252 [Punctularia strigosozonata HHB-11173 SS5]|uniref:uncharacterized protein n=1 Tax=Punctularia strigosozonata (strain HHB-11173) TaxID=741275 RepID=UPI0004416EEC|nr:uncharacterized protein PUNSTDRAFT_50252 [Punctularia strigosozonata HHB-11173 SS5]EIN11155.1 hypothetical protein PUNSTDRAFT_50252 [Punctularia strigosozonata HHB-11173 SS5]